MRRLIKQEFFLFLLLLFSGCSVFTRSTLKKVEMIVKADGAPAGSRIYLAGDGDEFGNWKADGVPLVRQPDGSWAGTVMLSAGKGYYFKVTRGHWWTEAIDERGPQGGAYEFIRASNDTTVKLEFSKWMDIDGGVTKLSAEDILAYAGLGIQYGWRYHPGDDSAWSTEDCVDSSWEIVNSRLDKDNLPVEGWRGIGWFRLHLDVRLSVEADRAHQQRS